MVYEFRAADRDAGDNGTLTYTLQVWIIFDTIKFTIFSQSIQFKMKVLVGNPIHFEMRQAGTANLKTGQLWVVQDLDYETEAYYLFSITVTVGSNIFQQIGKI